MKVPYHWITELTGAHGESQHELAKTLTLIGLEAEMGEMLSCTFEGVIAALVESVTPRGKGSLLRLSDGAEAYAVYSTAPGIVEGSVVAFAPVGARVGETRIEAATFTVEGAEVKSEGMVCSAQELGIGRESRGLLSLPGVEPGADLKKLLFTDEPIVVEYPSNRGDVLSLCGIARELATHFGTSATVLETVPPTEVVKGERPEFTQHGGLRISIRDLEPCPRYAARVITGVRVSDSPPELLRRLISLGLKPINNIVDITNLVLMELGQPLHPFDLDKIAGGHVIVRRAEKGEVFTTLDGENRTLDPRDLMIADESGSIAIAGVMGGKHSEVGWDTTTVLLESARFDRVSVRRTSRRHTLRTEASLRFERGIDPALVERALDRVAWYVTHYGLGTVEPVTISAGVDDPAPRTILADPAKIAALLGMAIPRERILKILTALGCQLLGEAEGQVKVQVPSWRADLSITEDLAEEVARHVGYNAIPTVLPAAPMKPQVMPVATRKRLQVLRTLSGMGYRELLTFPLGTARIGSIANPLRADSQAITLANALSIDQSVMAMSLLPGFLDAQRQNFRNRGSLPYACEINRVYWTQGGEHREADELALMVARPMGPGAEEAAFRALKGTCELLFDHYHIAYTFHPDETHIAPFATGMASRYALGGGEAPPDHAQHLHAGLLGVIDPALVAEWDVPLVLAYAHFDWEAVWEAAVAGDRAVIFKPLPKYPGVSRDLALVTPEGLRYAQVRALIADHGGPYLTGIELFDVFRGKQVAKGHKSLAFALKFQNPQGTLTDEEVNVAMGAILAAANREGIALRG